MRKSDNLSLGEDKILWGRSTLVGAGDLGNIFYKFVFIYNIFVTFLFNKHLFTASV